MNNRKYCDAMAEMLYYFNGIDENEIKRIPTKLMNYFKENATKDYVCDFDYNKPLKDLNLRDETKALIGMVYINYICNNKEEKLKILSKLSENEVKYQEELRKKYSVDNLFKSECSHDKDIEQNNRLVEYKEHKLNKIWNKILQFIHKGMR